jgi:PTS system mannose-specific IIA component
VSVGILIITHGQIGQDLLDTATRVLGFCPVSVKTLSVPFDCNPEEKLVQASGTVAELETGDGVLVLTDIYGSTPSNIANRLTKRRGIQIVSGINLPMLLRVLNYPELRLEELVEKAITGGHDGVRACPSVAGSEE